MQQAALPSAETCGQCGSGLVRDFSY